MKVKNLVQAINNAIDIKLGDDPNVVVYGEDVGVEGGVFRVTQDLQKNHLLDLECMSPIKVLNILNNLLSYRQMNYDINHYQNLFYLLLKFLKHNHMIVSYLYERIVNYQVII